MKSKRYIDTVLRENRDSNRSIVTRLRERLEQAEEAIHRERHRADTIDNLLRVERAIHIELQKRWNRLWQYYPVNGRG